MNAMEEPAALVGRLRATVRSHATGPLAWRIEQLTRLRTLLDHNRDALAEADLHRLPADTFRSEVDACIHEIDHLTEHLEEWLAPGRSPSRRTRGSRPARRARSGTTHWARCWSSPRGTTRSGCCSCRSPERWRQVRQRRADLRRPRLRAGRPGHRPGAGIRSGPGRTRALRPRRRRGAAAPARPGYHLVRRDHFARGAALSMASRTSSYSGAIRSRRQDVS